MTAEERRGWNGVNGQPETWRAGDTSNRSLPPPYYPGAAAGKQAKKRPRSRFSRTTYLN